MTMSKLPLDG